MVETEEVKLKAKRRPKLARVKLLKDGPKLARVKLLKDGPKLARDKALRMGRNKKKV